MFCALLVLAAATAAALAATYPAEFEESVVFSGLDEPTAVRFAPDGRVFVVEKAGRLKVFDSLTDPTPDVVADFQAATHDFWDRGALGLAVHPHFDSEPYVYVLYTLNQDFEDPGAPFPRWPDSCPDPPGATGDGCVVNGRLSRFRVGPDNSLDGTEHVLLEGSWCQQYPSHTVGALVFGEEPDHALYVSAGDGASFNFADYGQGGGTSGSPTPANPCGDPPTGRGGTQTSPTGEGGALRAQDLRTPGDPVSYDGSILRLDPDTGDALPSNPLWGGDPADDRIVAYGLRNPFRITRRPGTEEIWIGDVGWGGFEEINRLVDPAGSGVTNFGWPCYEGPGQLGSYSGLDICTNLYADTGSPATAPYYEYAHGDFVDPAETPFRCAKTGNSSLAGVAFVDGTAYPSEYDGALFFADYSRDCLFVLRTGPDGLPDGSQPDAFADAVSNPVDLVAGPDGRLYYTDFDGGRVLRIDYAPGNATPVALAAATPANGPLPLDVQFDATGSTDADPDATLTYEWDLDGDGTYDDFSPAPFMTYPVESETLVTLRVTDELGARDTDTVTITAGNSAPSATIVTPAPTLRWSVGQLIELEGAGSDPEDGTLGAAAMEWEIVIFHCPNGSSECHTHPIESHAGVSEVKFTAPDHEWLSYLEVRLTVTDSGFAGGGGVLTDTAVLRLDPRETDLTFETAPAGLELAVGPATDVAPFVRTVITGSLNTVDAPATQAVGGASWDFVSWSDGGARSHEYRASSQDANLLASYAYVGVASDWWDTDWLSRLEIEIDNSGLTESLFDVPLLVTLDGTRIDYGLTRNAGQDLRFVASDGTTTMPHETALWDESGTSRVWVRVPEIPPPPAKASFWLYYENASGPDAQDPAGVFSDGYRGVWHFDGDALDSSPHGNHGTNFGSTAAPGAVGQAYELDGNDHIDAGSDPSLGVTGQLTISVWVRVDDPERGGSPRVLSKKLSWDDPAGYNLEIKPLQNNITAVTSGPNFGRAENQDLDTSWHHVVSVVNGSTATIYLDGVDVTTDATCDPLAADGVALSIGRSSGDYEYWTGGIDELHIAAAARSAEWVALQHRSMTDTLLTYGGGQTSCGPYDATCDGLDDDCDGTVDEDPPQAPVHVSVGAAGVSWTPHPNATAYDAIRGDLGLLRQSGGSFAAAVDACLADDTTQTSIGWPDQPAPGGGLFVLVRAVGCAGPASYETANSRQAGTRDPEIASSGASCP